MSNQSIHASGVRINTRKLRPSYDASGKVERNAIADLVKQSSASLVLITAPAGYGKTTTLSQLYGQMQTADRPVGWLTIDALDNDLGRFIFYLWAALSNVISDPDASPPSSRVLENITVSADTRLYQLLELVSLNETPFVLFLDEFEHITSGKVLAAFRELVASLSPEQQVILGSRQKPDLPLGRLRVSNQLLEIHTEHLQFSKEETRSYISERLSGALDNGELDTLLERTGGWPAALQLAATALTDRADITALLDGLSSSSRDIADYLAEDVFARLPARQCRFLLETSLFDTFSPAMCDATLGISDSHELLLQTEHHNLFLQRIDNDGPWYCYHPLFRDFLQEQCRLSDLSTERITTLRLNAAHWLADNDQSFHAVSYALAAGEIRLAARLMEARATDLMWIGQLDTVAGWIAAIPDDILAEHPRLLIAGAYATAFLHCYGDANRLVELLPKTAQDDATISAELVALKIMLCAWSDHLSQAFSIAESARHSLADVPPYVAGLTHNALAYAQIARGRDALAHQETASAKHYLEPIGAIHALNYSVTFEGAISLLQGQMNAARIRFEGSLAGLIAGGHRYTTSTAIVAVHLAETLYETHDIDAAEALLTDYLPVIRNGCLPDHIIVAYRVLARIQALRGQQSKAIGTLDALIDLGDVRSIPRLAAASRLDKHRLALLTDDTAAAHRLMPMINDQTIWAPFSDFLTYAENLNDPLIAQARQAIVEGAPDSLIPRLRAAIHEAGAHNRQRRAAKLQCLLAQAFEATQQRPQALDTLEHALINAQAGGALRVFADEPWQLDELLDALAARKTDIAPAYLQALRNATLKHTPLPPPKPVEAENDPRLSQREVQILRLLAEGHSNKVLARKLFITENTIETHLRRIYGKLGISNRTQAVIRALEAGLI